MFYKFISNIFWTHQDINKKSCKYNSGLYPRITYSTSIQTDISIHKKVKLVKCGLTPSSPAQVSQQYTKHKLCTKLQFTPKPNKFTLLPALT